MARHLLCLHVIVRLALHFEGKGVQCRPEEKLLLRDYSSKDVIGARQIRQAQAHLQFVHSSSMNFKVTIAASGSWQ